MPDILPSAAPKFGGLTLEPDNITSSLDEIIKQQRKAKVDEAGAKLMQSFNNPFSGFASPYYFYQYMQAQRQADAEIAPEDRILAGADASKGLIQKELETQYGPQIAEVNRLNRAIDQTNAQIDSGAKDGPTGTSHGSLVRGKPSRLSRLPVPDMAGAAKRIVDDTAIEELAQIVPKPTIGKRGNEVLSETLQSLTLGTMGRDARDPRLIAAEQRAWPKGQAQAVSEAGLSLAAALIPYAGLEMGAVKLGSALRTIGAVDRFATEYPAIARVLTTNIGVNAAEAAVRIGTGQDYTAKDFFLNLAMQGAFEGGLAADRDRILGQLNKELHSLSKGGKAPTPDEIVNHLSDMRVEGHEFTYGDLFQEHRLAYKSGIDPVTGKPRTGTPGIDYPSEPGMVERRFRTDKLNLSAEDTARVQQTFEALGLDTRDVRTWDEVRKKAAEVGADPEKMLANLQNKRLLTDVDVQGLKDTIKTASEYLGNKWKLLEENPMQADQIERQAKQYEQVLSQATTKLVGQGTELGRAVNMYRSIAQNQAEPAYWFKEAGKLLRDRPMTPELQTAISSLLRQKDTIGLAHLMAGLKQSTLTEKLVTLWKAGLLTNLSTHLANIAGNITFAAMEAVKDIPATAIDILLSPITGKRTKALTISKETSRLGGMLEGVKKAPGFLRTGIDPDFLNGKWEIPQETNFNNAFLNVYTKVVFRMLGAEDAAFKYAHLRASLAEQAAVEVKNMSKAELSGALDDLSKQLGKTATRRDYIAWRMKNPSDDMSKAAIDAAEFSTFNNDNWLADTVNFGKNMAAKKLGEKYGPVGSAFGRGTAELVMPFVRTPANVAARTLDYSPVGVLTTLAGQLKGFDQKAFAEGLGRASVGTSVMALGVALYREGMMTSDKPQGGEGNVWDAQGRPANSVMVNGKWRQLNRLGPAGVLLSIGANFARFGEDKSQMDQYASSFAQGAKTLTDQTFLMGLSQTLKTINEPDKYAQRWVENAVGGIVPQIIANLGKGMDDKVRDTEGSSIPQSILNVIESRMPGVSQKLPAGTDTFGQEKKNTRGVANRLLDPFSSIKPSDSTVLKELVKMKAEVPTPQRGLYNQDEYRSLLVLRGNIMNQALNQMVASPDFAGLDDDTKRKAVRDVVNAAGDAAQKVTKFSAAKRILVDIKTMSETDRTKYMRKLKDTDSSLFNMVQYLAVQ